MRVALVTTRLDQVHDVDADLPLVIGALQAQRVEAVPVIWDDQRVDWTSFDLIVMRSPWDYSTRYAEFNDWLDRVSETDRQFDRPLDRTLDRKADGPAHVRVVRPAAGLGLGDPIHGMAAATASTTVKSRVLNCRHVIRWSSDKVYLAELARAGVPVVPTSYARSLADVSAAIAAVEAKEVVIKPTVSAGSKDTGRFVADDPAALLLAQKILGLGKTVMVQPSIDSVHSHGECALLYFDGEFSHAARKGPILDLGGGLVGGEYSEAISTVVPDSGEMAVAEAAHSVITNLVCSACDCGSPRPLYARFDVVKTESGHQLLEAELFEPAYFLWTSPGASDRFASAVVRRLPQR